MRSGKREPRPKGRGRGTCGREERDEEREREGEGGEGGSVVPTKWELRQAEWREGDGMGREPPKATPPFRSAGSPGSLYRRSRRGGGSEPG